jgi:hypothetical protein
MLVAASRSDSEASNTEETARISWDDHKNKPSFFSIIIPIFELVLVDTGYILYITNQYSLFNNEIKPYRQNIQVRDKRLYLEGIGIIIIKLANK